MDQVGDRNAYQAAEQHLRQGAEVRRVFGANAALERTGGSVMAGQVVNWNGIVRGNGLEAKAAVGMHRKAGADSWTATRAKFQLAGEGWRDAYIPVYAATPSQQAIAKPASNAFWLERGWRLLERFSKPSPREYLRSGSHPLITHTLEIARLPGADAALLFADSAGRLFNDDLLAAYAGARALAYVLERPADATTRMQRYVGTHPSISDGWAGLAEMHHKSEDYRAALRAAERAIALDTRNEYAYLVRGLAFFKMSDWQQALPNFERACELNSSYGCQLAGKPMPTSREP
jgi:tetratricopeptide (TPR) repeat protein